MDLVDSAFVDVKIVDGKIVVEASIIAALRAVAKKTDNTLDDALVDLVEKALAPKA